MKKSNLYYFSLTATILLVFIFSCAEPGAKFTDTPTSGNIKIAVDNSYEPIIDAEIYTFEAFYKKAKINAKYAQESEVFDLLMNDSVRLIICNREFNKDEKANFSARKLKPRITKIAYDALAIIVHPNNLDTLISMEQLNLIFNEKISSWKNINPKSDLGKIKIVFDNTESSNARWMREKFLNDKALPENCYAASSHAEVIDYVSKNKNAIGMIGVNWVSDKDDTLTMSFLKKINMVSLSQKTNASIDEYYKPYQAYIKLNQYPLTRNVYIISREARAGLGTGFASFVAGIKGQQILLKSGMVPAKMPARIIQMN